MRSEQFAFAPRLSPFAVLFPDLLDHALIPLSYSRGEHRLEDPVRSMVAVLMFGATLPSAAQQAPPRKPTASMFVELAGNSAFGMTANVEFRLSPHLALRAGMGGDFYTHTMVLPAQVVYVSSREKSALEASLGVIVARERYPGDWHWDGVTPFPTGFAGYRYQSPGGFLFRLGVVPLFWTNARIPWVALSLGHTW